MFRDFLLRINDYPTILFAFPRVKDIILRALADFSCGEIATWGLERMFGKLWNQIIWRH